MAHGASTHSATPEPARPLRGAAADGLADHGLGLAVHDGARRRVRRSTACARGWIGIAAGFMLLLYMMVRWFGDVIRESEGGKYSRWEDVSFRWGMSFFIFSEVMFFAAFFGALFWARVYSVPDLATIESNALVWPGFTAHWPSAGPNFSESFTPDGRLGPARAQHRAAAHLRRDHHLRALEPARQQPRQADPLARRHHRARRRVPDLPGDRVRARVRASSTSRCTPGSTARPSSCSPASTASTSPSARSC